MLNLHGIVDVSIQQNIREYTRHRFASSYNLTTPEALSMYEQRVLEEPEIRKLCEKAYGFKLPNIIPTYIPDNLIEKFDGSGLVPVTHAPVQKILTCIYLPELKCKEVEVNGYLIEKQPSTIYDYVNYYTRCFGKHPMLLPISAKVLLDGIMREAISLDAMDISLYSYDKYCNVFFNVRKHRIDSNTVFASEYMESIIKFLTKDNPYVFSSGEPKYEDIDYNEDFRLRIVLNKAFKGYSLTMRILPNDFMDEDFDNLGYIPETGKDLKKYALTRNKGLTLIVGETASGKNTTARALLSKIVALKRYKVVSIEQNVEQVLPGVVQINSKDVKEFGMNIRTLIHQNPDYVYVTEIRDEIARDIIQITNTGKCVLSTLHSNSCADTISRLVDITGFSSDRIIQTLNLIVYQELVRDDEKDIIFPRCRYVHFSEDFKYQLYGKPLGEVFKLIKDKECGDEWTSSVLQEF